MGRARQRRLAIVKTGVDPGPDRSRKMATERQVTITIKNHDDGTTSIEGQYDLQTLAVLWIHIMLAIDQQTEVGKATGIDFLKDTVVRYKAKFSQ